MDAFTALINRMWQLNFTNHRLCFQLRLKKLFWNLKPFLCSTNVVMQKRSHLGSEHFFLLNLTFCVFFCNFSLNFFISSFFLHLSGICKFKMSKKLTLISTVVFIQSSFIWNVMHIIWNDIFPPLQHQHQQT
jgi:hypothetical protein